MLRLTIVAFAMLAAQGPLQAASQAEGTPAVQAAPADNTPEARMKRRFPQEAKVGDLIGLPVLDDNDLTLGHIVKIVRTPEGKIRLIVSYSRWFGWFGRPVAVPIEVVVIMGRQLASVDMQPAEYAAAPTWAEGRDEAIGNGEIIRVALGRR
jgi:hypothetical protein